LTTTDIINVSNFIPAVLFQLLEPAKLVHILFGFQVYPKKVLRLREVRRPGWLGNVTKT
jgi:hypothetical protein